MFVLIHTFTVLFCLLVVCSGQDTHFYGTVITSYPGIPNADGSMTVLLRYKLNFQECRHVDTWTCLGGNCGTLASLVLNVVYEESNGGPCQREGIMTRLIPHNGPFWLVLEGGVWINMGFIMWRAVTMVDPRNRSDTGGANRSPQTTVLPALRVPSNCQIDLNLLAFDPDGDEVRCRYTTELECSPCTQPSVLTLSSSCALSFRRTATSDLGPHPVQLMMEDFPRRIIFLTQTDGQQAVKFTDTPISSIPVYFILQVDAAVPSCREGVYRPRILPPTPANRARLYSPVNQTLEISIRAEADTSTVTELLFSGPYNMNQTTTQPGQYILRWTPSESEDGQSHPVCFVVQALFDSSAVYQSELRCVIVTVGDEPPPPPTTTQPSTIITPEPTPDDEVLSIILEGRLSSLSPLSEDFLRNTLIQQVQEELVRRGVPRDVVVRLVSSVQVDLTTTVRSVVPV